MICHTEAIASTWQPVRNLSMAFPEVVIMRCNVWLAESSRTPELWRHDHNVDDQNMVVLQIDLSWLQKEICYQNTMLMIWKIWKFKDENLKILGKIFLEIVPPFCYKIWVS